MKSNIPITIKELNRRYLLGLVNISYRVEDRRPDLDDIEASNQHIGKYKHYITVKIIRKTISWEFRTEYLYDRLPYEE